MLKIDHKPKQVPSSYVIGGHDVVHIGPHSYTNQGLNLDWWGGTARLRIGSYCSVADGVKFFLSYGHRIDWITSYPFAGGDDFWLAGRTIENGMVSKGDITLGSDVWVGNGACILSGVTLGHGAIVGTASVVTKDVPAFAFVAGNPARVVRYRFSEEEITDLLALGWWDWPEHKVRQYLPLLCSTDIRGLRAAAQADPELSARPISGAEKA